MNVVCAFCGKQCEKPSGQVTRARNAGLKLYCNRVCAGLGRRKPEKTKAQKVEEKRLYDIEYRAKNLEAIKEKKAAHYAEHHDREREKAYRKKTMARHVEYCRRPEYRAQKKVYDRRYRAEKFYGELADAFVLTLEIRDAALEKAGGDYELRLMKGTLNKSQQRKRDYERLDRKEPEECALGNLEQGERR